MNRSSPEDPEPLAAAPLTGTVLAGRFEVEALLGRGGMSEVYRARQAPMGRPCALKVIRPDRATDREALARFEREAALASRIAHPNLCHIYDYGVTAEGLPFLAMELLEGPTLTEVLAAGPVDRERAVRIAGDCAAGLAAIHEAGIVHRDLKAGNVMLVRRDGTETAVITDFGIARGGDGAELTRDGLMVGTPEVMSPEQIAGDPVGPASDQYQLGLLVVRLLTGSLPFQAATTQETMVMRLTVPPARLADLRPGVDLPLAVQPVIDRALARRPADRWPAIRDFAAALSAALHATGDAATERLVRDGTGNLPAGPADREPVKRSGRRWPGWAAGAAVLVALGVIVTAPWRAAPPPIDPAPPPAAPGSGTDPALPPPPAPVTAVPPPPAAPLLPSEEAFFSQDPAVRLRAREAGERVYRSAAPDSIRALAAFLVAEGFLRDTLYATARVWLENCLALQERSMCRQLLNTLP